MNLKTYARLFLFLSFSIALFSGEPSVAMTGDEIQSAIQGQMNQRHPDPPANFWTNLGPESVPVLEKLLSNSTSPYEQSWIINGLGHFSDPSIAPYLESKIQATTNAVLEKKMLDSLITSQGDSVYDFVEPYLSNPDPHIRLAVAKGMRASMSGDRVNLRLAKYLAEEKTEWAKTDFGASQAESSRLKRGTSVIQGPESDQKMPSPLPEKDWAGEWKGLYMTSLKTSSAVASFTSLGKSWKVEIKLPKQSKYELKQKDLEILYYQSLHAHWIEVRSKKDDAVFIGRRNVK